jgi:hypothetical protein
MQNMVVDNEFKQLREIIENRNGSVVAHGGMIVSFKYGYSSCFLPCSRDMLLSQAQIIYSCILKKITAFYDTHGYQVQHI